MTVENALDTVTTVHWHGLLVPGYSDGGPQQLIRPGDRWRPVLKIDQPAATLWFHPHPHHDTARQIYMGLTGMIIVDDGTDAQFGLPRTFGMDDLPLILQDRSFASDGSLEYETDGLEIVYGARGDTVIVNGAIAPVAKSFGRASTTSTIEWCQCPEFRVALQRSTHISRYRVGWRFSPGTSRSHPAHNLTRRAFRGPRRFRER